VASPSRDILILGGGVLGLGTAVTLTARGHRVRLLDLGDSNASSIAAGMIAPALESLSDGVDPARAALLRQAADLWPDFAARLNIPLRDSPSLWRGADPAWAADRLTQLGFPVLAGLDGVHTGEHQVEPELAMRALRAAAGTVLTGRARAIAPSGEGWTVETDAGALDAQTVVLATGAAKALPGLPGPVRDMIAAIVPIRGQIGWTAQPLVAGVRRGPDGYIAAMGQGAVIGASMGVGRRDLAADPAEAEALTRAAAGLADTPIDPDRIDWRAGIRGATADGLPLAGPSGEPGLHLALAPRRNGWLLAPLVGRVVADGIEGRAPDALARALDPLRFSPRAG
jgi:glycine oxidase